MRKNTLIILLCCAVVIGSIGVIDVLHAKWWKPPLWLVKMWTTITRMEDTLAGKDALISAMEHESEVAGDEIVKIQERQEKSLIYRNKLKLRIKPDEQAEKAATIAANAAVKEHDKARSEAKTLREEIAELEAKLLRTSPSDEEYGTIQFAINLKKASLARAEHVMKTEKAKYDAARKEYNRLWQKLIPDRGIIARLTYTIDSWDSQIESLQDKIKKLTQDIKDEKKRRAELAESIKSEKAKYKKHEEDAKKPGPQN